MRALGAILILAALAIGLPGLFLESWLGDVIFVVCIAALIAGVVFLFRPLTAREIADGAGGKHDLIGTAIIAGSLIALVVVAVVVVRYTAV